MWVESISGLYPHWEEFDMRLSIDRANLIARIVGLGNSSDVTIELAGAAVD
jgi:hypothetical protein